MLTPKDVEKMKKKITNGYQNDIKKSNELYKEGVRGRGAYPRFLIKRQEVFKLWDIADLEDLTKEIANINKFLKKIKKENPIGLENSLENNIYNDDYAIFNVIITRYEIPTMEQLENRISGTLKGEIREIMFKDMKEKGYEGHVRYPDCKLLDLFRSGKLTYVLLLEMTYSDCKI